MTRALLLGDAPPSLPFTYVSESPYDAVVIGGVNAKDAIVSTNFGDLIPSSANLCGAGVELIAMPNREFALQTALQPLKEQ